MLKQGIEKDIYTRTENGINLLLKNINTSIILMKEVGLKKSSIIAALLYPLCESGIVTSAEVAAEFGKDIENIIEGLLKVNSLYVKNEVIESDNFRKLLLSFAEDIRVIIIMIADRLTLMRLINHHPNEDYRLKIAQECTSLYTPLAHQIGRAHV